ncbi:MAG: sodium/sugar symporter [Chitinophagaceae bacterium]|nr:sodium/sugar symporter [Chitinophagaceae bacterium]
MDFSILDIFIFVTYCVVIVGIGLWVSRSKDGAKKNTEDYFLASKSLPWWAIGSSLIAANISAEQYIGMSGSGFAIGLAIASYEWMAALTLLVVGKFFLPIFIEKNIYTIPEFVEKRYSTTLKTILAVFWICLFVFVNLTSVMFLGAKAIDTIIGTGSGEYLMISVIGLGLFACLYSLWGGLSAVAWTDVVQVVLLIFGGLVTTYLGLQAISPTGDIFGGFIYLLEKVPQKFSMIIDRGEVITPDGKDAWWDLPGLAVIIGGMWVANTYYWGFNQYIIQRTLAAKSLNEAQKGIAFAAFIKLFMPLIVVLPGIIAFAMHTDANGNLITNALDPSFLRADGSIINDNAAPWLIKKYVPVGLKGLVLAALAAAIVSSLASMLNSIATIFTMDIYKPYLNPKASESHSVNVGRVSILVSLAIATLLAPLLSNLGQVFLFIQEYTGIVSPGILAVFLMGLFSKKATNKGALWGGILSIPIAFYFKVGQNGWIDSSFFINTPFMNQMLITSILTMLIIALVSYIDRWGQDDPKGIPLTKKYFETSPTFNIAATFIICVTILLYAIFW